VTDEDGATSMIGAITVDTASIETSTVTINTLTISGKQVTLDVFRQLQDAVLINDDGSLAGPPWGMANYHQKSCDKLAMHVHAVWQLGDQLRQGTVQPPRWEPYWSDVCDAWVFAAGTVEPHRVTWGDDPVTPPPQNPVRPRQIRWWCAKFGRNSHRKQDTVRPTDIRLEHRYAVPVDTFSWCSQQSTDVGARMSNAASACS